jgi:hypothetical protein
VTEHSVVIVVSLAIVAAMAILIYVVNRVSAVCRIYVLGCGQLSAFTAAYELRQTIDQIFANTGKIDRSLQDQRRVLNDAHKRICTVTKGGKNPPAKHSKAHGRIRPIRLYQKVWVRSQPTISADGQPNALKWGMRPHSDSNGGLVLPSTEDYFRVAGYTT